MIELVGVFHVHSRYSDGRKSVPEILRLAKEAGLDYVLLSEHDTLAPRREGWEGMHDGVALLCAVEITPRRQGHVLAMNVNDCCGYAVGHNRATLDAIRRQGGYAIVAHPAGKRKLSLGIDHRPWYDWSHPAIAGLEIWSYMHDWIDEVALWRLPQAYEFYRHPERRVAGPQPSVLRQWDALGRTRTMAGFGGLDCHGIRVPIVGIEVIAYERMFRFLRNHLFVHEEEWRRAPIRALWRAHASGNAIVVHSFLADGRGCRCRGVLPDGREAAMGAQTPFLPGTRLELRLPRRAQVRWIENGRCRLQETADELTVRPAVPGVHRFEARLDGEPWLFTNPVYLR